MTQLHTRTALSWDDDHQVWIACGHDVVREIAERDADFVSSHGVVEPWQPAMVPVLTTSDGALHRELRALAEPAIRTALASEPTLRHLAAALAECLAESGGGELVEEVARPLASAAVFGLLGVPDLDRPLLAAVCRSALSSAEGPPDHVAGQELIDYLFALAALRREARADDLVGRIACGATTAGPLDDEAVVRYCRLFLEAGLESTSDAIAGATIALAGIGVDPGGGGPRLIEELLRHTTPIAQFGRVAARTTTVGGITIVAGQRVILSWFGANYDSSFADPPHALVPDRRSNHHLAFGAGVHRCLGAPLARLVVRVFVDEVLARWRRWRVTRLEPRRSSTTRGWDRVDVTLDA